MFVLDTDHCVALLRGQLDLAGRLHPRERVAVTAITVGELVYGAGRSRRPEANLAAVHRMLQWARVLPLDRRAAEQFAQLKLSLETQGHPIGDFDLLIASIALVRRATLVTHNARHCARIPGLELADWL